MKNYLLIISISVFWTLDAMGQASLEISLVDSLNQAIPFHPLQVKNEAIGYQSQHNSNAQGKVQLDGLSTSGTYSVFAPEGSFFKAKSLNNIQLSSRKKASVVLQLSENVISLSDVVIESGRYQSINRIDAEVASELTLKEIEELPIEARDINRALYRLPNITQATGFFPEAPIVAINGANALYTNYQMDGMDNNENFLGGPRFPMPMGMVQNITALTNNFSAEHGLTANGIINVTTRSGTNELSGEAFYVTRPGAIIDASSPYAQRDLSGNQVKDGFQRHQGGFGIGGPLKKDQTFYFINYEATRDIKDNLLNVPQLGINETVRGRNNFDYLSLKLDHHWSDRFHSSLRMNAGWVQIERQGGGIEGGNAFPSTGNVQDRNSLNLAFKNTYRKGNFTYEGNYQYGRFRWNYANPEGNLDPDVTVLDPTGQVMAVVGHPGFVFNNLENSHLIQQKLTYRYKKHRLKAGVQLRSSGFELFGGGNPNGSYLVQLNPDQLEQLRSLNRGSQLMPSDIPSDVQVLNYGVELRPNAFSKRQNIYSAYLEDQWSVSSRLNLSYGLRYDFDNLSRGGGHSGDWNNIAPRLSANYSLDKNTSFRAGYGMYYDKILYAVYSDAMQFSSRSDDFRTQVQHYINEGLLPAQSNLDEMLTEGNLVANDPNASYLQGPGRAELESQRDNRFSNELRILNPNGYQNPYSHQLMLGIQRKVNEKSIFYIDLMHNRSYNLFRLRNLNASEPYPIDPENVVLRSQAEADASRTLPIGNDASGGYALLGGDTLRGVARNVMMTETAGRSNYYALNFTWQKSRGEDNYSVRVMYTLSYLENNTEDINFRAMDANNFENEWGPSINDRTHLINTIFNYYPMDNLTITLAGLIQSGQPINRIPDATLYGTTDLNGDGLAFGDAYVGNSDRSPGEARNNDRLPWANTLDLSAFYYFPLGKGSKLELGATVFNVLNAENLSGYPNNALQSNQIQPGPASSGLLIRRNAAPPRQFQFSLRYLF